MLSKIPFPQLILGVVAIIALALLGAFHAIDPNKSADYILATVLAIGTTGMASPQVSTLRAVLTELEPMLERLIAKHGSATVTTTATADAVSTEVKSS
jgi:hypothetical protein